MAGRRANALELVLPEYFATDPAEETADLFEVKQEADKTGHNQLPSQHPGPWIDVSEHPCLSAHFGSSKG